MKILNQPSPAPAVDLRELGFRGYVSDAALREIEANDERSRRVITTANRFVFRSRVGD